MRRSGASPSRPLKKKNSECCLLLLLLLLLLVVHGTNVSAVESVEYLLVAVSGGLQTGFPDHNKMNYRPGEDGEVKAIFVGRALVRGCKAFLDVMQPGWRQYSPEPEQPLINSVVMVSGCFEHANQYWVYLVDKRQALSILNNEPRFLSITPDTVLVDLTSNETDPAVKHLARYEIEHHRLQTLKQTASPTISDFNLVALPTVVVVYYHESFVPSPPIRVHYDGTLVTNFAESLSLWANVNDSDRTAGDCPDSPIESPSNATIVAHVRSDATLATQKAKQRYWDGIRRSIRLAEVQPLSYDEWKRQGPPFSCDRLVRLGTSPNQLRINYPFTGSKLIQIFEAGGYRLDLGRAQIELGPPCHIDSNVS